MSLTLTLAVADLERTEAFYGHLLGLRLQRLQPGPDFPELLLLTHGDTVILFRQQAALEASHPALFEHLDRQPKGVGMTLELELPDLETSSRMLHRKELHLVYELDDREFDRQEIWLHDPDGYLLILSQAKEND